MRGDPKPETILATNSGGGELRFAGRDASDYALAYIVTPNRPDSPIMRLIAIAAHAVNGAWKLTPAGKSLK